MRVLPYLMAAGLAAVSCKPAETGLKTSELAAAERVLGLEFDQAERDSMRADVAEQRDLAVRMREQRLPNHVVPALQLHAWPAGFIPDLVQRPIQWANPGVVTRPDNLEQLAFRPVTEWAELVRTRQVSSVELVSMVIGRIKRHDPQVSAVVTLLEGQAMQAARQADREIASGRYRGPLHGIPYGAKDLLAYPHAPTTWGSVAYRDQVIGETATVIRNLEAAGAILVAKLSLGELAWGDVWFGGMTRNPWNLDQGSSGSSAGSAAVVSAGLLPFAIGSETHGSIISPSTRTGVTGLRPTFGRVSRHGAMALSWSMDKLGPICRFVQDCALVFDMMRGPDGYDAGVVDAAFNFDARKPLSGIRIGYTKTWFEADYPNRERDAAVLAQLRELGADLRPFAFPEFDLAPLSLILSAEAAAAFEELTLSGRDDLLVRQIRNAWPNVFRAARFISAVDYIQANRVRTRLIETTHDLFRGFDVVVTPTFAGGQLLWTNLTGNPAVVVPNGFNSRGAPTSITFIGPWFGEADMLRVAQAYQDATTHHLQQPPLFKTHP